MWNEHDPLGMYWRNLDEADSFYWFVSINLAWTSMLCSCSGPSTVIISKHTLAINTSPLTWFILTACLWDCHSFYGFYAISMAFQWNAMEFHGMPCGIPWNAMDVMLFPWHFSGILWHPGGMPWNSMECHERYRISMAFQWNSMPFQWNDIGYRRLVLCDKISEWI